MANLDFGKNDQEAIVALKNYMTALHSDWYGNGRTGWRDRLTEFLSSFLAVEQEREKVQRQRHEENSEKLDMVMTQTQRMLLVVAILALFVTAMGIYIGYQAGKHAELVPFFHANQPRQEYADRQMAVDPLLR